ncbi:MAG: hypothetical protein ACI9LN_001423 [Saprospiraceae bacterium]|jgi:hypothetical protein
MKIKSSGQSFFSKGIFGRLAAALVALILLTWALQNGGISFDAKHKSIDNSTEGIELILNQKAYNKIRKKRKKALSLGVLLTSDEDLVKGKIKYKGKEYEVKTRLKGDWTDHLVGDKWSFRIKLEGEETIMGMRKFSLQHPKTRNYVGEWLFHQVLQDYDILNLNYQFVPFHLKIGEETRDMGLYAIEESFVKQLFERQKRRAGLIVKIDESLMWEERAALFEEGVKPQDLGFIGHTAYADLNIVPFSEKQILKEEGLKKQFFVARDLLRAYVLGDKKAHEVFDLEKLVTYNVICDLFGAHHAMIPHNWRLYYNPITSRLEPIGFDANGLQKFFYLSPFQWGNKDLEFMKAYAQKVEELVNDKWHQDWKNHPGLTEQIAILKNDSLDFIWNKNIFDHNFSVLKSQVLPKKSLNVFLEKMSATELTLSVENFGNMPVQLLNLNHQNGRSIGRLLDDEIILPKERKTVTYQLDKGFEKLFVNKKKKKSRFNLAADIKKVILSWSIYGTSMEREAMIHPWKEQEIDITNSLAARRAPKKLPNFPFLTINEKQKTITCKAGRWELKKWLQIPPEYTFKMGPGCHLDFHNFNAQIISYSPVELIGTKENPISITSKTGQGAGIFVIGSMDTSIVRHCLFDNLGTPRVPYWGLSGAVNFYESPVKISETIFRNNRSEDALNIIKTSFTMNNVAFANTQSDAFDGDFVEGSIVNSSFNNLGNDAIDISGSSIQVKKIIILNASDKGLSAGENSKITGEDVLIQKSEVAVASKDLSQIIIKKMLLKNNNLGITAFQKKSEFGPCNIEASDVRLENNQLDYLIERGSSLMLNGSLMPVSDNVKERMYGTEFGKSSR